MKDKNIWLMNHYATQMYHDKAGRHYWFAEKLIERQNDVTVFCANTFLNSEEVIDTGGKLYIKNESSEKVPFVFVKTRVGHGNGMARVRNMYSFYKNLVKAGKCYAKEEGKPDVIVASSVHPLTLVAGLRLSKKFKIPCICEVRDLWPEAIFAFGKVPEKSVIGRALKLGEHWIYKKADALIFTKEGDTDYLLENKWTTGQGGDISLEKCHYINNGINLDAYVTQIKSNQIDDEDLCDGSKFNVIYAGTIRPVNNVGNILDVAKLIKEKGYDDIRFLIYGDGMERKALQDRIDNEGIGNVRMKGFVERKYIPYILSKASVNLLNYAQGKYNWTRGNSSNKLFEYMASGKPIISTVKMGYSIIKKYNCGDELQDDTPEALACKIIDYYNMSEEKLGEIGSNAKEGAKDFDFHVLTDKLETVIEEVL